MRVVVKIIEIIGGVIAGVAIAAALLFWRLNQGPITLDMLSPYLEQALSADENGVRAKIGGTRLIWAGWDRAVDLRATDVQAIGPDGGVIAALPEISIRLSLAALARRELRPTEVEVVRPRLRLTRAEDGSINLGLDDAADQGSAAQLFGGLLDDLSGPPRPGSPAGMLRRLVVTDADVSVSDLAAGILWRATAVDLRFERSPEGLRVRILGDADIAGLKTRLDGAGRYVAATGTIETQFQLHRVEPAALAGRFPELRRIKLAIDGSVQASFDKTGRVLSARLEAAAGPGAIEAPELYAKDLPISGAQLRVRFDRAADTLEVERMVVDLGGPVARLSGRLTGIEGRGLIEADAVVANMGADQLAQYWPAKLGPNARAWVTENISQGTVPEASLKLTGELRDLKDFSLRSIAGGLAYENLTVRYLAPMPPVRGVRGTATFSNARFDLAIAGGTLEGLRVGQSTVALTALDTDRERAEIEVVASGPVKDALRIIDSKPLGYASRLGLEMDGVAGDTALRLRFAFPLSSKLRMDQVAVSAAANLRGVALPRVVRGWNVSEAKGTLSLDGRGMNVKGDGRLQGVPVSFDWRENFDDAPAVRRRFDVVGRVDDGGRRALDLPLQEKATGPVQAHVIAEQRPNGTSDIDVRLDLKDAAVRFQEIAWKKPAGTPATARFVLKLERASLRSLEGLEATAADLDVRGRMDFDQWGNIAAMDLPRLKFGASDIRAAVARRQAGGYDIRLQGERLDLTPMFADDPEAKPKTKGPALGIDIQVAALRLNEERTFGGIRAVLESDGSIWRTISAQGQVGKEGRFALTLAAAPGGRHRFHLTSADAGAMLRAMRFYDNMVGGQLVLDGIADIEAKGLPFEGDLTISDFTVIKAPALARLATLPSFSGIFETLSGSGMGFSRLTAKLKQTESRIEIVEALAAGAIGITARGWIERKTEIAEIEGTAVPAYAINRIIGAIPLIGTIITGGQNEGIVAADFRITGPLDQPDVRVNPLSALAPGILRRILRSFGRTGPGGADDDRPDRAATEPGADQGGN
jgi:hypothetical protein